FMVSFVHAHNPESIELTRLKDKNLFKLNVKHITHDKKDHYIKKILIYKNGTLQETFTYLEQAGLSGRVKEFPLKVSDGDSLEIEVFVHPNGKLTASFEVDSQEESGVKSAEEKPSMADEEDARP
ncbi:MAG: hypothetical protein KC618_08670, partial [Candidatus Omnitrophica bacterium]|nr:hypothetical protein [Candidatus Omnitrophota bacterium]